MTTTCKTPFQGKDGITDSWEEVVRISKLYAGNQKTNRQNQRGCSSNNRNRNNNRSSVWSRITGSFDEGKYLSSGDARNIIGSKQTRDQRNSDRRDQD